MTRKGKDEDCCAPSAKSASCCRVESLISVDDRGQMVLPKEIRDRAKIRTGDKLAVVTWERDGRVCCISLVKVDELTGMVKDLLGPLLGEILKK